MKDVRVFIASKNSSLSADLKDIVNSLGYFAELQHCNTIFEVKEHMEKFFPKVLIVDICLLYSRESVNALKLFLEHHEAPIIFINTGCGEKEIARAFLVKPAGFLHKPITKEQLQITFDLALMKQYNESMLIEQIKRLNSTLNSINDAIIAFDKQLCIIEMNEGAKHICNIIPSEATGTSLYDLNISCSKDCIKIIDDTLKQQKPLELYNIECTKKGHYGKRVSFFTYPIMAQSDYRGGVVVVIKDEKVENTATSIPDKINIFPDMVGQNKRMVEIFSLIENLSGLDTTVLISGESGTGKELVAEAIHFLGVRKHKPLVKVNCSALSENLLESELFGHVKGAFTGAHKDNTGRFERAEGGTIFLDEIGDISHSTQLKLLRVLQDMEFERVGDSNPKKANVRVIAATNQDLREKVKSGIFRQDLYYRLQVVEVALPPLRQRTDDIPLLVETFIKVFNKKMKKNIIGISEDVKRLFMEYPWPGNIRELEHAIEHATVFSKNPYIIIKDLPANLKEYYLNKNHLDVNSSKPAKKASDTNKAGGYDKDGEIVEAIIKAKWNKSAAAKSLGISRQTLYRKLKKIDKDM